MGVVITESEMQFGEYPEGNVFQIEKCDQYTKKLRASGIKTCEFILKKHRKLYFIEAKKSCPNQIEAETSEEKMIKYQEYIHDIASKMRHSLMLYSNILLERYDQDGVPTLLKQKDLSDIDIRLVLVVKNAEKEWLIPFQDVLQKMLKDELKIWKIQGFHIINEETAKKKNFII